MWQWPPHGALPAHRPCLQSQAEDAARKRPWHCTRSWMPLTAGAGANRRWERGALGAHVPWEKQRGGAGGPGGLDGDPKDGSHSWPEQRPAWEGAGLSPPEGPSSRGSTPGQPDATKSSRVPQTALVQSRPGRQEAGLTPAPQGRGPGVQNPCGPRRAGPLARKPRGRAGGAWRLEPGTGLGPEPTALRSPSKLVHWPINDPHHFP